MHIRVGIGYDVHQLAEGRKLILGGIEIPHEKGCVAHSDGDVLLHAICDALLGAANLRDIGFHFPDNSPAYKNISSLILLEKTIKILKEKGYILNYKFEDGVNQQGNIKIALKFHPETGDSAIKKLERISKPGLRKYCNSEDVPRVLNGLGIAIISTSKGVITDKEARDLNVGGEVLCYVY